MTQPPLKTKQNKTKQNLKVVVVTWCFTPTQPLRLYQSEKSERMFINNNRINKTDKVLVCQSHVTLGQDRNIHTEFLCKLTNERVTSAFKKMNESTGYIIMFRH